MARHRRRGKRTASTHQQEELALTRLRSAESLEKLRDRVENAVSEISRLREENVKLSKGLGELQNELEERSGEIRFSPGEEVGDLRQKVEGFIAAIDRYLELED